MNIIDRITKFGLTCDIEAKQGMKHFHCGHEYVEIGGIKWATMNVGSNRVTDNGLYFQWGDTKGYTADQVGDGEGKKYFDGDTWYDYKFTPNSVDWGAEPNYRITKYNDTDGKKVLDAEDDAVSAAWGSGWRMPTTAEFRALGMTVNTVWTEDYQCSGVAGLVCTDKSDPRKVLFFPSAGLTSRSTLLDVGIFGFYWSSSLYSASIGDAYYLGFGSNYVGWGDSYYRYYGYPMRGVVN